ncbi:MAG: ABC transporter ATP-binding protein [Candidatus Hydrothermales bacterium]
MSLIQLLNVRKIYKMGKIFINAIDGISLKIEKGEYIAIMGPSGSGKSTLLHIMGFLDRVSEGKYIFKDKDISDYSEEDLARIRNKEVGFVFQSFHLIPRITALQNVELPLIYRGIPKSRRIEIVEYFLREVGLFERRNHRPHELSGGEMQRVAIARALVSGAEILLADEPTGNLDTKSGNEILDIFDKLNEKSITIIVVTHDHDVSNRARRIVFLRDGKIEGEKLK